MPQNRSRRLSVALAGISALALMGIALAADQLASYARVQVSDKTFVYIQVLSTEIRFAMSADDLKTAAPVKPGKEVTLPIPADQLPAGITAVKGNFTVLQGKTRANKIETTLIGTFIVCRADDQKAQWQYTQHTAANCGPVAESASAFVLPELDKLKLEVFVPANKVKGKLGVGVHLMAGNAALIGIVKNGKDVRMQMSIQDSAGKEIATKTGSIGDFGFSWAGPCYSVGVAKGEYKCVATMDLGNGTVLKGDAKAIVP